MAQPRRVALLGLVAIAMASAHASAQPTPAPTRVPTLTADPWDTSRFSVSAFTDRNGLPQNTVRGLAFDASGRLWVGTQDGLVINDGRSWQTVALPEGARFVHSLAAARDGGMYVGTLEGGLLHVGHGGEVTRWGLEDGLPSTEVYSVLETDSDLWAATGNGVARRTADGFRAYRKADGLPARTMYRVAVTRDARGVETVWAGGWGGLVRLEGERWVVVTAPGLKGPAQTLVKTRRGDHDALYVGTTSGVCLLDGGRCVEHLDSTSGAFDEQVNSIAEGTMPDGSPTLWLATEHAGVVRLSPGSPPLHIDQHHGLPGGQVNVLVPTPSTGATSSVWVGLDTGGLAQIELGTWRALDASNGLTQNGVNSVLESRSPEGASTFWVGTQGGLVRLGPEGWADVGLAKSPILALLQSTSDGAIWVGLDGGVARMAAGVTRWWKEAEGLPGHPGVSGLVESRNAAGDLVMWVGLQEGLAKIEGDRVVRSWAQKDGLPEDFVVSMTRSVDPRGAGTLWLGTTAGLASLDEATGEIAPQPFGDGPADHFIMSLLAETRGGATTLWAGTRAGLWHTRLDDGVPEEWVPLPADVKAKLPNLVIDQVLRDRDGRLLLFTNHGVARLDDPDGRSVTVFGVEDGMPSAECDTGASMIDSRGRVWAGTAGGMALFDPAEEVVDRTLKPLLLEKGAGLAGRTLDWDAASARFEYALASFRKADATRYRTQLVGWESAPTDWSPDARREYSNLPGGHYDFLVWGRDADGNVSGPVSTAFDVRVAPWNAWWAWLTYAVVAAGFGLTVVRLRESSLRTKNAALEASVAARTREIAERNDELAAKNVTMADNLEQLLEAERRADAKARELDRNLNEMRRLNAELVASQVQADRIFSALAEALPGTVLDGKYRLEARIGAGGFGAVFRATHLALKRPIAVKVFKPSPGNDSAQAVERFRREGQTAALLTHPNAVRVLDAGVSEEGIAYLVMELLEGRTLADELHAVGPMGLDRVWHVLEAMCDVLAEAHGLGIVHRDVKPSNIILHQQDGQEIVKVVDFGIAKLLGETSTEDAAPKLTMTGGFVGTPVYMAPERLMNKAYGAESDVYSVGVVCFQMLTGQTPYHTSAQNLLSLVWAHVHDQAPSLRELRPDISDEIDAIVRRALASDPAARPTMQELATLFAAAGGFVHAPPKVARASGGAMRVATAPSGVHATHPGQGPGEGPFAETRPEAGKGGAVAKTAESPAVPWPGAATKRGAPG